ncbi:MAG: LPXTG cell wall anchor domain-containing protein, partial [Pseudomonadota bacterium]
TLPSGLTFTGGPGTYNSTNRTLTYKLTDLKAGETVRTRFTAKVRDASIFGNADITCDGEKVVNHVKVTGPDGQTDQDTASLCVQTKVLGATTLPVAGFDDQAQTIAFAALGIVGLLFLIATKRRALS